MSPKALGLITTKNSSTDAAQWMSDTRRFFWLFSLGSTCTKCAGVETSLVRFCSHSNFGEGPESPGAGRTQENLKISFIPGGEGVRNLGGGCALPPEVISLGKGPKDGVKMAFRWVCGMTLTVALKEEERAFTTASGWTPVSWEVPGDSVGLLLRSCWVGVGVLGSSCAPGVCATVERPKAGERAGHPAHQRKLVRRGGEEWGAAGTWKARARLVSNTSRGVGAGRRVLSRQGAASGEAKAPKQPSPRDADVLQLRRERVRSLADAPGVPGCPRPGGCQVDARWMRAWVPK